MPDAIDATPPAAIVPESLWGTGSTGAAWRMS
jgi:hypothetical protein